MAYITNVLLKILTCLRLLHNISYIITVYLLENGNKISRVSNQLMFHWFGHPSVRLSLVE